MSKGSAGDAAQGHDRPQGKVDAGGEEDEGHADREDTVDRDLPGDVGEVRDAQEGVGQ